MNKEYQLFGWERTQSINSRMFQYASMKGNAKLALDVS